MKPFSACLAGVLALAASGCTSSPLDRCLNSAKAALDQSHATLGSPAATDWDSLEKVARGARAHLLDAVTGDPDARISTSVLDGKIRIWAHCGGKEGTLDWTP